MLGAGLGAWSANEIVKYEEKTKIELEAQIEESKKANRRRFQGESAVPLLPGAQYWRLRRFIEQVLVHSTTTLKLTFRFHGPVLLVNQG